MKRSVTVTGGHVYSIRNSNSTYYNEVEFSWTGDEGVPDFRDKEVTLSWNEPEQIKFLLGPVHDTVDIINKLNEVIEKLNHLTQQGGGVRDGV